MDKIEQNRLKIDEIDDRMMILLDKRYELTTEIGNLKKQENIKVLDHTREMIILEKISKFSHSPQINRIYNTILKESKDLQRK